jgi:catechol 2,3-dioxygenase-like lactoylglutathione lyase family enzyme
VFRIGKLYHVIHIVSDIEAAERWYSDVFSVDWFQPRAFSPIEMRDASLGLIGDFVIEPMVMAKAPGAEERPTGRFYKRFGQHLHSIAFFVDNHQSLYERMKRHNIRIVASAGARTDKAPPGGAFFTHPRDTACQFEMMDGARTERDPRFTKGWSPAKWRDHPLGIEITSHITVLVRDLAKATALYAATMDTKLLFEEESPATACKSAYLVLGEQTVVELAMPLAKDSLAGEDMEKNGEIVHAVTWRVKDLARAESYLASKGLRTRRLGKETVIIEPADAFGAVLGFTSRRLPKDPRKLTP